jgi:hypothetical protein
MGSWNGYGHRHCPVSHLVRFRTSHPDCTGHQHSLVWHVFVILVVYFAQQSVFLVFPDCTGQGHTPVWQQGCTTSPLSHSSVEHLFLCGTSHPKGTEHRHPPVQQEVSIHAERLRSPHYRIRLYPSEHQNSNSPHTPKKHSNRQADGDGQVSHKGSLSENVWDGIWGEGLPSNIQCLI